ncbi:MAG TPA: hypothetical protein VE326_11175 [Candidatus Binatia bacterium]|nr:hypothetical protein [Candidatus Binatia bacterium]
MTDQPVPEIPRRAEDGVDHAFYTVEVLPDPPAPPLPPIDVRFAAAVPLWRQANARDWALTLDLATGAWSVACPDQVASAGYEPPSAVCTGVVSAYTPEQTLTRTGVTEIADAVVHIRAFLGWPEVEPDTEPVAVSDVSDVARMDEFATIAPGGTA